MANDIIDITVGTTTDNIEITVNPNLTTINVIKLTGNISPVTSVNGQTGDVVLTIPSSTSFIPYTGAISDINLGEFGVQLGNLEFDTTPTNIPTNVGSMVWNDIDGTLDLKLKGGNTTLQIGQETVARIVNKTSTNITLLEANYQAIRVTGAIGQRPKVDLALADTDLNSATTLGLVTETILNNQEGFITTSGQVREINTTGSLQGETWIDGDVLYLSGTVAGRITNIKPTAPIHTVIIGFVEYAHAIHGKIFVKVNNGYELEELHNVSAIAPNNNEVLAYDLATTLWKPKTVVSALGYTPYNSTNPNGYISSVPAQSFTSLTGKPTTLLGYGIIDAYPLSGNPSGFLTSITSLNVTNALGYTPYNATNPNGYTTNLGTVTNVSALTLGTSGTDVSSTVSDGTTTPVITLNIPTASALNRGALSSTDWITFNSKISFDTTSSTRLSNTSGINTGDQDLSSFATTIYVNSQGFLKTVGISNLTATGTPSATTYLRGDNTWATVTSGSSYTFTSPLVNTLGTVTINQSNISTNGYLSFSDWSTFNSKQNALSGTGFVKSSLGVISYDTNTYITGNQSISLSGAVTGSGTTSIATTLANSIVGISNLNATGTPSATTYLRGDNTWATVSGGSGSTAIGGTITGATAGSILFAGVGGILQQDNANLFFDDTNNRFGIGTTTPTVTLDINGNVRNYASTNASNSVFATSSSSVATISVKADTIGGFFRAYGSSFDVPSLANNVGFGPDGATGIVIFSNSQTTFNGTGSISLRGGGYDTASEMLFIDKNGSRFTNGYVGIGTTTIGSKFQVNGNAAIGFSASTVAPTNGLSVSGGIVTGTTSLVASAQLQIDSTTKGFLPPRMTNAQRIAIATPAVGLCVYCTDASEGLYVNKSTGWVLLL